MNDAVFKIQLTAFVYAMVRGFRRLIGDDGMPPWDALDSHARLPWFEMVCYRLLTPFGDAGLAWDCLDARGWRNDAERHTAHELVANICRIVQLGLIHPDAECCNKRAALSVSTMFNCGLPKDHTGVCVPAGADPIPEAKPQYTPGDDE